MEDPYLFKQKEKIAGQVLEKERVYIDDPSEAPEGAEIHEGEHGGIWYDSAEAEGGTGGGGGDAGGGDGAESGGGGAQSDMGAGENPDAPVDDHTIDVLIDSYSFSGDDEEREALDSAINALQSGEYPDEGDAEVAADALDMYANEVEGEEALHLESAADQIRDNAGGSGGGDEMGALGEIDDQYVPDSDFGQQAAEQIVEELGDDGVRYVEEAMHQNGDYFQDHFDGDVEEAIEDARLFTEL